MTLTLAERLILINQYRILANQDPSLKTECDYNIRVLEAGFEIEYRDLHSDLDPDVITVEQSRQVLDIFEMYRALQGSYDKLGRPDSISEEDLLFQGFDGNNEAGYVDYAYHVLDEQGRYESLDRVDDLGGYPNSLSVYGRMLEEWRYLGRNFNLSEAEITHILLEKIHPDNR